jgi:hypothetical protein
MSDIKKWTGIACAILITMFTAYNHALDGCLLTKHSFIKTFCAEVLSSSSCYESTSDQPKEFIHWKVHFIALKSFGQVRTKIYCFFSPLSLCFKCLSLSLLLYQQPYKILVMWNHVCQQASTVQRTKIHRSNWIYSGMFWMYMCDQLSKPMVCVGYQSGDWSWEWHGDRYTRVNRTNPCLQHTNISSFLC